MTVFSGTNWTGWAERRNRCIGSRGTSFRRGKRRPINERSCFHQGPKGDTGRPGLDGPPGTDVSVKTAIACAHCSSRVRFRARPASLALQERGARKEIKDRPV